MQHVVISFDLLQNMRFRWSRNLMNNWIEIDLKSNKEISQQLFEKQCKSQSDF